MDAMRMGFAAAVAAFVYVCPAATRTLKPGLVGQVDLADAANYEEGVAPSAGDTVMLRGWVEGKGYTHITNSIAADPASWELLKGLANVQVAYGDTFALVVDGELDEYELPCAVNGVSDNRFTFSKLGPKRLNLTSCSRLQGAHYKDYYGTICVEEGTLALPVKEGANGSSVLLRELHVADGARLVTAAGIGSGSSEGFATRCSGISGGGVITNESSAAGVMFDLIANLSSDMAFSGTLGGPIRLKLAGESGKSLRLTADGHAYTKQTIVGGMATLETATLSGLGTGALGIGTGGGTFRYVGTGADTFSGRLYCTASPGCLDGGTHGALTFSGTLSMYSTTSSQNLFCFSGDGERPCVFNGAVEQRIVGDAIVPIYLTKKGKGTWRFLDNGKDADGTLFHSPCGTFAVEEGTLEFDTIANRGERCSLGYATACYERVCGEPSALNAVDYAYLLGADNAVGGEVQSEGRFVYIGTENAQVTNRAIAVQGNAAIGVVNARRLRWFDVRSSGAGGRTLALESEAGTVGDLYDIVDSEDAPISVEKRGNGTWRLGGRQTLHGGVAVKSGSLIVENAASGSAYKWFRFIVKETSATCARYPAMNDPNCRTVAIGEISLSSADGIRCSFGLADAPSELEIEPGTCQFGCTNMIYAPYKASSAACYFDNVKPDSAGNYGNICRVELKRQPRLDDESTWWPAAVMRLPDDTPEIVAWDFVMTMNQSATHGSRAYQVTAARLEGSTDGVHWETVGEKDDIAVPTKGEYYWASTDEPWQGGDTPQVRRLSDGKGWALSRTTAARATAPWTVLSSVSVSSGAALRFNGVKPTISRLNVDRSVGVGVIENAVIGSGCSLDVVGVDDADYETFIPAAFENVEGLENAAGWNVTFDGEGRGDLRVSVSKSGIRIRKTGLKITIR